MSDFRRFCIAFLVAHGLIVAGELLRWLPEAALPKRALVSAFIAAGWVAAIASRRMRNS